MPVAEKGFTVFLTGLPAAGKSTLAKELRPRLAALTRTDVVILDGDDVRERLEPKLGFSRIDRDKNIERVAMLARGVVLRGGIAICAVIAPYDEERRNARAILEPGGGFVLVYMATPLGVCESRDPKGLYAQARAGLIPNFTGISDPYEPPTDADITIDASTVEPDQAVQRIVDLLRRRLHVR